MDTRERFGQVTRFEPDGPGRYVGSPRGQWMASHDVAKAVDDVVVSEAANALAMVTNVVRSVLLQMTHDQRVHVMRSIGICHLCGWDYGKERGCLCARDE